MTYANMYVCVYMCLEKTYILLLVEGGIMITVNATKLRNNLFEYLDKVSKGETITIRKNGEDLAMVVPPPKKDWRSNMRTKMKLLAPTDIAFAPMDDIWENYL
jgi:prevent-host-death family protein